MILKSLVYDDMGVLALRLGIWHAEDVVMSTTLAIPPHCFWKALLPRWFWAALSPKRTKIMKESTMNCLFIVMAMSRLPPCNTPRYHP